MGRSKILSALRGSWDSSLARGEIWVSPAVLQSQSLPNSAASVVRLAAGLGADSCFLSCTGPQAVPHCPEALLETVTVVKDNDLACGIVIDGPWQRLVQSHGLLPLLERLAANSSQIQQEVATQARLVHAEIRAWAEAGADLLLLADDLAYSGGPYFSPDHFPNLLLTYYREFLSTSAGLQVPLGFHSDGNLTLLLPALVESSFYFFSLEPEAVDMTEVQNCCKGRAFLLSGIRSAWLSPSYSGNLPESNLLAEISLLAQRGKIILSSSSGLSSPDSVDALRNIYRIADRVSPISYEALNQRLDNP